MSLLPASYRPESDDIAAPARDVTACVAEELDLRRLTRIHGWLWVAGRPTPPRPLHHQRLLGREILVTEQMDMHLVWTTGRIFLKPIPRFLLEPRFWAEYICCGHRCDSAKDGGVGPGAAQKCKCRGLRQRALGFLFSYAALITHESDFFLAVDKHLVPAGIPWSGWRTFVEQLGTEHIYQDIDSRFYYGELRLSRLNKIYSLWFTPLHGYMPRWDQYSAFLEEHFAWLASAVVYIAIVLAAMQVGLATKNLADDEAFQSASRRFAVFSIVAPLAAVGLVVLVLCYQFATNWVATVAYKRRRLCAIHRSIE